MSDLYKVGIHLAVSGNANAFFSTLGTHLLGIHRHFGRVHDDLAKTEASLARMNRMKLAIGGGISIVGGVEILKAAGHLETAGEKLVHAQTVLGAGLPAATRAASVLDATAAAWAEAGKNMNTTVTSNIEAIHDLYNVVQDMDHAKGLLPAFTTLQTALNSIKDGSSIGEAASAKNVASAVRAFELMGKTDPHALEEMSRDFVRTTIALRGRVDGGNFLTAVQGAGDARYGWGNEFATKGFPAMVNAMGTRAGNLVNMLNNNLYGGVASSGIQAGYQIKYGLHRDRDLEANGKAFKPGTVYEAALLRENPLAWAGKYRERLSSMGVNVDDLKTMQDIVARIGRGNRSVKAALDELLLPMTNRQLNKEVTNIGKVGNDAAGVLQENDPKLLRDALHKQWENLQTAIGEPLVKPAMEALKALTGVIKDLSQAAAANPGAAKMFAEGIVALGAALTTGGVAAIIAAIGPVGWIAAGITALGAAILKADPSFFSKLARNYLQLFDDVKAYNWSAVGKDILKLLNDGFLGLPEQFAGTKYFKTLVADFIQIFNDLKAFNFTAVAKDIAKYFNDAMLGLPALVAGAITEAISGIGTRIKDALKGIFSKGLFGDAEIQQQSFSGSGIDPSMIHRASIIRGGGANDNAATGGGRSGGTGGGPMPGVPSSVQMSDAERNMLGLIQKYESHGGNTLNYVGRRQGISPLAAKGYTAQGYYQILNSNWRRIAPKLGITAPNAMAGTLEEQTRVALELLRAAGGRPSDWAPFNPALRGAIRRGERYNPVTTPTPTAREPAPQKQPIVIHTALNVDGKKMARVVSHHQAEDFQFPKSGGTHRRGDFGDHPGVPVQDAA